MEKSAEQIVAELRVYLEDSPQHPVTPRETMERGLYHAQFMEAEALQGIISANAALKRAHEKAAKWRTRSAEFMGAMEKLS